jgi:hypothetical protein
LDEKMREVTLLLFWENMTPEAGIGAIVTTWWPVHKVTLSRKQINGFSQIQNHKDQVLDSC